MQSSTTVGTRDKINELLDENCTYGSVGAANALWLAEQEFDFILNGAFQGPVTDSRAFGFFLESLAELENYPLFDEDILNKLQQEWEEEEWDELLHDAQLDPSKFWEEVSTGDYPWTDEGQADLYGMTPVFNIEDFVKTVKTNSQTWEAHYNSGQFHEPEVCQYCKDAYSHATHYTKAKGYAEAMTRLEGKKD